MSSLSLYEYTKGEKSEGARTSGNMTVSYSIRSVLEITRSSLDDRRIVLECCIRRKPSMPRRCGRQPTSYKRCEIGDKTPHCRSYLLF